MKQVNNEVSQLKRVMVHRPDEGLERVTPDTALEFLYDDITYLPEMQEEHDVFTNTLRAVLGEDAVVCTEDLLLEVLRKNADARKEVLRQVQEHENIADDAMERVNHLSAKDINYFLFNGVNPKTKEALMMPLPNYVFTRDIGVVINDYLLICQAAKQARTRENILSRCIFYNHPEFRDFWANNRIIDLTKESKDITVEGGDVMVLNSNYLLVGQSERTTPESITRLGELLFKAGVIDNIVRVEIPDTRSYMHIDTVFTQISADEFVAFDKLMEDKEKVHFTVFNSTGKVAEYDTLKQFLQSQIPEVTVIKCGNGESPYDAREQWTDGCNLVALRPGLAIAYRRNFKTAEALQNEGYTIMRAETFLQLQAKGEFSVENMGKVILTIPSSELSRARGGPHCMTFPFWRS